MTDHQTRDAGAGTAPTAPLFFSTPGDLRAWLIANHATSAELWVGLHKKATGRPSITWPELVDQLLCFGWIDGVRKSLGAESYVIRTTPRRPGSTWSAVNLRRGAALIDEELMEPAGLAAWEARDESKAARYSFERQRVTLGEVYEAEFRRDAAAWSFFESQPPGYRKTATWWVVSAKREETRQRRLRTLIEDSAAGRRIGVLGG